MLAVPYIMAGVSAAGALAEGREQRAQLNYQAQVAENNRVIAEQNQARALKNAEIAQADAQRDAMLQDQEAQQELGALVAAASASGLSVGVGSAALKRKSAASLAARDRGFIIAGGENAAEDYRMQALNFAQQGQGFQADAGMLRTSARNSRTTTALNVLSAGSTLLGPNTSGVSSQTARRITRPVPNPRRGV